MWWRYSFVGAVRGHARRSGRAGALARGRASGAAHRTVTRWRPCERPWGCRRPLEGVPLAGGRGRVGGGGRRCVAGRSCHRRGRPARPRARHELIRHGRARRRGPRRYVLADAVNVDGGQER
ncbi:hypothetical protein QJS66_02105 [Kocuria rhizophila]|nr:hypothetical protein QJS66_02105 [Kocuria rhizophila]